MKSSKLTSPLIKVKYHFKINENEYIIIEGVYESFVIYRMDEIPLLVDGFGNKAIKKLEEIMNSNKVVTIGYFSIDKDYQEIEKNALIKNIRKTNKKQSRKDIYVLHYEIDLRPKEKSNISSIRG